MRVVAWLFNSILGNATLVFVATLIIIVAISEIFGHSSLSEFVAIIAYFAIFQGVYSLFGPSKEALISDEQRRNLRIATIAIPVGILAFNPLGLLIPAILDPISFVLVFAPALFVIYLGTKIPKFKLFDVWQADVPFEEKDDSKMRPVITVGTSKLGHEDMIECLYVTSKDKDFDPNFRGISALNWDLGPAESRQPRSWARINKSVSLSQSSFNRFLGSVDANDIPKLERALSDHRILPENPRYAVD